MHPLLLDELSEILELPASAVDLGYERSLLVAAATVAEARHGEVNATRVVGDLGPRDPFAFENHVARLAEEFELDARVRFSGGGFSVRFSRVTGPI